MEVIIIALLTVRDINIVDRLLADRVKTWPRMEPPLFSEAWASPPWIGKDSDAIRFDENRGVTNERDSHDGVPDIACQ